MVLDFKRRGSSAGLSISHDRESSWGYKEHRKRHYSGLLAPYKHRREPFRF